MHGECCRPGLRPSVARRPGSVHASLGVRKRRVPWDVRRGVLPGSNWDLPEGSLRLVPHSRNAFRVLTNKPGPEGKGDLGERTVGYVLVEVCFLVHLGAHVAGVDAEYGDALGFEFDGERFGDEVEGGFAGPVYPPSFIAGLASVASDVDD